MQSFKKMAIVGVGGKVATMFAFELGKVCPVLGIGQEIKEIKEKKFFIERKKESLELFNQETISPSQFPSRFHPDFLLVATRNPVYPVIREYYQKIKKEGLFPPTLLISQNGFGASEEAILALKEIFSQEAEKIRVARVVLFNPIEKKEEGDKIIISYSRPLKIAFGSLLGPQNLEDLSQIFQKAQFQFEEIPREKIKAMEFSKLFLNLIGIASSCQGFSLREGLKKREVFKEEILILREFTNLVKREKNEFLNFKGYPVKFFSLLINFLPLPVLFFFQKEIARFIIKKREEKEKELSEIDYYQGAVVKIARELKVEVPLNEKVWKEGKKILAKIK